MKIGIEVEGRLKGLTTLFINADDVVRLKKVPTHIQQIYISDPDNQLDLFTLLPVLGYPRPIVTVERTSIPNLVSAGLNLVLRIRDWDSFERLRPTDQIKFEKDLVVYTCAKEQMVQTHPKDFSEDTEVKEL